MKIDSHQHFWKYSIVEYDWINEEMEVLKKDFLPSDLLPLLQTISFDGTIAVQARQSIEETEWLLQMAEKNEFIKGVVGWLPLCSDSINDHLKHFSMSSKFVGLRHVLQDEPDEKFMLRPDFLKGLNYLGQYDLAYDILIYPKHLNTAAELVSIFPKQRFILDHIAKPPIKTGHFDEWKRGIEILSNYTNVACKLSGMVTETDWNNWKPSDLKIYLDIVFNAFGADRLMIGSDWPVCILSGSYQQVMRVVMDYISGLSSFEQAGILGDNALKNYNISY